VAARNARAKELRQAGARDEAAEIGALRRPSWTDWALNTAAHAAHDEVRAFAEAADAMRTAQREALAGHSAGVGAALREVRARTTELARRADAHLDAVGRASDLAGLVERLTAVAASAVATTRLRDALLRDGDETLDAEHGLDGSAPASRPRRATSLRAAAGPATPPANDHLAVETATARRDLMRLVAERERALRTADHHVARAEHTFAEAESKRDLAAAALARAQADLDRAAERADSAAATVADLRTAAADVAAELARTRAELDALGQ
jgi:hypothetical protein